MSGSYVAPGCIRLQQYPIGWNCFNGLKVFFGLEATAVQADVQAEVDELFRKLGGAVETVNDPARPLYSVA